MPTRFTKVHFGSLCPACACGQKDHLRTRGGGLPEVTQRQREPTQVCTGRGERWFTHGMGTAYTLCILVGLHAPGLGAYFMAYCLWTGCSGLRDAFSVASMFAWWKGSWWRPERRSVQTTREISAEEIAVLVDHSSPFYLPSGCAGHGATLSFASVRAVGAAALPYFH